MSDKRIDAHTNTTTVADVDEFIVDSGSNGTRNITYSNLKDQLLGTTSIATIGNSVTEAIYNTYTDIGDLTQTGVTGATVAAQISQLNAEIDMVSGGISAITHGNITASTEDEFFLSALADIKADSNSHTNASINRIYTWSGHDYYAIQGYRVTSVWIYAFVYSYDRAYILSYNTANATISSKKTFTLT